MIRGRLTEPLIVIVRGISLIKALRRHEEGRTYTSVQQALSDFTSGAGEAVPTAKHVPPANVVVGQVHEDWRNFLRVTTIRERL